MYLRVCERGACEHGIRVRCVHVGTCMCLYLCASVGPAEDTLCTAVSFHRASLGRLVTEAGHRLMAASPSNPPVSPHPQD